MPCRPPRQRVLIAHHPDTALITTDTDTTTTTTTTTTATTATTTTTNAADVDVCPSSSITTDVDLSDHPLGMSVTS